MGNRRDGTLSKMAMFIVRHWLGILIVLTVLFLIPPVAYPWMMSTGNPTLQSIANVIFQVYGPPICDQIPTHSLYYNGYQMGICARCFAIYTSFIAGCILFAFVRTKLKIWSLKYYILLCVPMAIDGTTQLLRYPIPRIIGPGWQLIWTVESTTELRLITGTIFGLSSALFVLPYLQEIFREGTQSLEIKNSIADVKKTCLDAD